MGKYLDNRVRKNVGVFDPRGNFQETNWLRVPQSSNVLAVKPADRHNRNFGVKYQPDKFGAVNMYYFDIPLQLQKDIVAVAKSGGSVGAFLNAKVYGKFNSKKVR